MQVDPASDMESTIAVTIPNKKLLETAADSYKPHS